MLAPGAHISAAGTTLSGTSQAAPHVSGALAVLRSAFPADSLDDTLSRLQNMGVPVTDRRNNITKPRLNFDADEDRLGDICDNCPSEANTNQEDADEDGSGDICDICPDDPHDDLDGDTICGNIDTDDDGDGMPDSWEDSYVGLNPLKNDAAEDLDGDGYTNFEEYTSGTNPTDQTSLPFEIVELIPNHNAGVEPDQTRVANDTSFSIRIHAAAGIDVTENSSVQFTINDGSTEGYSPYVRDLADSAVVRIVKLSSEPDSAVIQLWAIYDRSNETTYGTYAYGTDVNIKVDVKDRNDVRMPQARFDFQVESETEHSQAQFYQPDSDPVDPDDPGIGEPYNTGIQVNSGSLEGAKIFFNSDEPVKPRFGPENELSLINVTDEELVGIPLNLQPPNVFDTPVKVFIPCPGFIDVSRIKLYGYNGTSWVPALDELGNVLPGGKDFIVPNTRINHDNGFPSTIETRLYHFTGLQPTITVEGEDSSSPPQITTGSDEDPPLSPQVETGGDGGGGVSGGGDGGGGDGGGGGGGGGCFFDTLTTSFEDWN